MSNAIRITIVFTFFGQKMVKAIASEHALDNMLSSRIQIKSGDKMVIPYNTLTVLQELRLGSWAILALCLG